MTCKDCIFWRKLADSVTRNPRLHPGSTGLCELSLKVGTLMAAVRDAPVETHEEFSCTQYEDVS